MNILALQKMATRCRDLTTRAFITSKHKDANLYTAKLTAEKLVSEFDSYVSEIGAIRLRRMAIGEQNV